MRHFLNISVLIHVIFQKECVSIGLERARLQPEQVKNLMEEDVENNITWQNIIKPLFEDDMN